MALNHRKGWRRLVLVAFIVWEACTFPYFCWTLWSAVSNPFWRIDPFYLGPLDIRLWTSAGLALGIPIAVIVTDRAVRWIAAGFNSN